MGTVIQERRKEEEENKCGFSHDPVTYVDVSLVKVLYVILKTTGKVQFRSLTFEPRPGKSSGLKQFVQKDKPKEIPQLE